MGDLAKNEDGLLPCPFYGSDHIKTVSGTMHEGWKFYKVFCASCQMRTEPIRGKAKAKDRWNRRI